MYKVLVDSDSLIKLAKIDLLKYITKVLCVEITEDIYGETVVEGRKRFYQDADNIQEFVDAKKIMIVKKKHKNKVEIKENFGIGELSIIRCKEKKHIIVTDDIRFTRYLQSNKIMPISSANLIVVLKEKLILTKQQAIEYLERLKPYIRSEVYINVKNDIGGE